MRERSKEKRQLEEENKGLREENEKQLKCSPGTKKALVLLGETMKGHVAVGCLHYIQNKRDQRGSK
jgi:hypothetical protein